MGNNLNRLPERVREHVRQLVEPAGLAGVEGAEEQLAEGWLEKHKAFDQNTAARGMAPAADFSADEVGGALVMTYSGSIVSIGPMVDGQREVAYASVGARRDVPRMTSRQDSRLAADIAVDRIIEFDPGPVVKTSPVFAITVFRKALPPAKEQAALAEVTQVLTERFVVIDNDTLHG
jgi:hypothetical protein